MYLSPLYVDEDLLAVDKPAGLLTHPAEVDGISDSAVELLRRDLDAGAPQPAVRDGRDPRTHLGVHQRLDRDTSGLLLFARTARADRALAAAFARPPDAIPAEDRPAGPGAPPSVTTHSASPAAPPPPSMRKTYLAVVYGRPPRTSGTIDAPLLAPGPEGRVTAVRLPARGIAARAGSSPPAAARPAATAYRVLDGDARRGISLVEAMPLTGRTHQARAHLALAGCPVAGDALYDPLRREAPRLCLHAMELSLPHPRGGACLDLHAPPPPQLADLSRAAAVLELVATLAATPRDAPAHARSGPPGLCDLLGLAVWRRAALAADPATTAYRLINGAGDGLPGVTVDLYGDVLSLNYYDEGASPDAPSAVVDALVDALAPRVVYARVRPRRPAALAEHERAAVLVAGRDAASAALPEIVVAEDGLAYALRPAAGLSSGLFLDMREVRGWVRRHAAGRTVLNLFAYTCAFGVAATAGGAARVLNLDAARPALEWGKRNYALNGFAAGAHDFVYGDAFDWLARFARRGQTFDLVIADPPSFATTRASRFSARGNSALGVRALAAQAAAVVAPGGLLIVCSNLAGLAAAEFRRSVRAGLLDAGRQGALLATASEPGVDFPRSVRSPEGYLKVAVLALS